MSHKSNIQAFLAATKSTTDALSVAYCGLVAIELNLKALVDLRDHNVPAGIHRFRTKFAVGHKHGCGMVLSSLAAKLTNDIKRLHVQGKDGKPRAAPPDVYPYIRYTRIQGDGWDVPQTPLSDLAILVDTVGQIRNYLRTKFGLHL